MTEIQSTKLTLQEKVSQNLRIFLAANKKSQKALAVDMGVSTATLSEKFSGRIRWNLDDIEKASEFLHMNPEALVAGQGFEPWTSGLKVTL